MRVLHVHSGNLYGGIETVLVTLANSSDLCPAMEQHFALCFEGQLSENLRAAGAQVYLLGGVRIRRPKTLLKARKTLSSLLKSFDLVICHSAWSQAIFGPVVRAVQRPLVFWLHCAPDGRHWLERWARRVQPDLVICNSHFTRSALTNLYPRVPAQVIYYPVASLCSNHSLADRGLTRAELNTPEDAVVIVQASRMESWKGHSLLLTALGKLADVPGWVYWQVGGVQRPSEISYLEMLKSVVSQMGIADRVHFLGQRSDVARLMAAADIYCQPNTRPEPFGVAIVEALYAGLPVVATAMGGPAEVVDQSCGILISPDEGVLVSSLKLLIEDQVLRRSLGMAGPARAEKLCDPQQQIIRLYKAFSSISSLSAGQQSQIQRSA
jgi:glycosyltransferase involved in cell wall biosynthesis